jgi:asparagine synthetase B (glutamine-hydrolysing)
MKLIFNNSKSNNSDYSKNFGHKILALSFDKKVYKFNVDGIEIFFEGQFYYSIINGNYEKISDINFENIITLLTRTYGVENISKYLEGVYQCFWIEESKKKAGFFSDNLNRANTYYAQIDDDIEISSNIYNLTTIKKKVDQLSLYCYLLLGHTAQEDTLYSGIKKLRGGDFFLFSTTGVKKNKSKLLPKKIEKFSNDKMNDYDNLFSNAVLSRSSNNNIVMSSGGWDSTSILHKLVDAKTKGSVKGIVWDVKLADGNSFNSYEVDKVLRIGNFFNIETEKVTIDYNDVSLIDYWESNLENLKNNHMYFWLHHLKVAETVGLSAQNDTRVFNGECSDSIHNFGFSQFVSVNFDNKQLREMADKAKSYLYGPNFFKSVISNSFKEDKIFNFFYNYYGKTKFVDFLSLNSKELRKNYFESFVFSYQRVPFANWQNSKIANAKLQETYANHMENEYFIDLIEECQSDTLYYWLLQLYRRFHFNSYQIGITQAAMKPFNINCVMPFLDDQLLDYMYRMPENWGRGLELRTTKYPLRFLAEHKWNMPIDILTEKGPHSYIAENNRRWSYAGGSWSLYCEIMYNSVFTSYFKSIFLKTKLEDFFDPKLFKVDYLSLIIKDYINGKENPDEVMIIFRLALLFSIGTLN